MSSFCIAKATHIFFSKNISVYRFNDTLTNDIVSFEQPGSDDLFLMKGLILVLFSLEDILHEMQNPIFSGKKNEIFENIFS